MEYSKGKIVEGKIIHVAEEYLLVKFPNKETGILHKSKISHQQEGDLTNLYRRNQSILVSIDRISEKGYTLGQKDIDRYENQLRHEAKELEKLQRAEERERMKELVASRASQFERGGIYEAEVISLSNQVAKISIDGIDGYIKKDELNWNENDSVKESLFEGEIIRAVFLEYTDGKLLFGLKYLEEKPYDDDLYSLSTEELLKKIGHNNNVFIAEAKNIKGLCLTNLYSEEGNLLINPVKGNNIIVRFVLPTIEEGKFYKVHVELLKEEKRRKSNDLFSFYISNVEEVDNPYKRDVKRAFSWHDSPASNSSLANILDTVGLQMYSSAERMFFELIQNADDAASRAGVIINIDQKDDYLIFTHNGFHFSYKDFESLVSAAKSTKSSKEKTGYKGIGFKSVFTNSQQVFVDSGGYHFKFDKDELLFKDFDKFYSIVRNISGKHDMSQFVEKYTTQREAFSGVKDIPWQLLPIWCDVIPETLKKSAFAKNQKVSFALNIKNQKIEDYVKAIEFLFDNPKFILFLRHTNRLDLKFANKTITKDVKDGIVTIKNSFSSKRTEEFIKRDFEDIPISNEAFDDKDIDIQIKEITNRQGEKENKFYDNNNHELEDIPDRIASSQTTTISFVANYDEGIITENKGNSLYAYLPMNEHRFRFPFYINADFVLHANRETLLDSQWNYYLLANIGQLLVDWVAELANKGVRNYLKLLPFLYFDDSTLDVEQLAQSFNSAYRTALETKAFILNHKGVLAKQENIIIDKTGLSEIVGADLFCKLLGTDKFLPSENIDSKILEKQIFEQVEHITNDIIHCKLENNLDLNEWYIHADKETKNIFNKWVIENDYKDVINSLPIFEFDDGCKSPNEIAENDNYIVISTKFSHLKNIIVKLGLHCSNLFDNENLYQIDETILFNRIYKKIEKYNQIVKDLHHYMDICAGTGEDYYYVNYCQSLISDLKEGNFLTREQIKILAEIKPDYLAKEDGIEMSIEGLGEINDMSYNHYIFNDLPNAITQIINETALTPREKLTFINTDFYGIGDAKIKEIELFYNINNAAFYNGGEPAPLQNMLSYRNDAPDYIKPYMICEEENFPELQKYLICSENEFENVIMPHLKEIVGRWNGCSLSDVIAQYNLEGQQLRELINEYSSDYSLKELLIFVEDSDKNTKEHYLNKIEKLDLQSTSNYKKDSYEYRVLKLALDIFDEPSDFSSKIYFDGQCIKDFTVSDDVICEYTQNGETKKLRGLLFLTNLCRFTSSCEVR